MHDVKTEAALDSAWSGGESPFAMGSKKLGMWLFIVSDTLTFSALADHLQLFPAHESRLAAAVSHLSGHHFLDHDDGRAAGEFADDGDGRDGGAAQ